MYLRLDVVRPDKDALEVHPLALHHLWVAHTRAHSIKENREKHRVSVSDIRACRESNEKLDKLHGSQQGQQYSDLRCTRTCHTSRLSSTVERSRSHRRKSSLKCPAKAEFAIIVRFIMLSSSCGSDGSAAERNDCAMRNKEGGRENVFRMFLKKCVVTNRYI